MTSPTKRHPLLVVAALSLLVAAASCQDQARAPHSDEVPEFLGDFEESEVTTPIRLLGSGAPLRHHEARHFRARSADDEVDDSPPSDHHHHRPKRHRRAPEEGSRRKPQVPDADEDDVNDFRLANYTLRAFGEVFTLNLAPYRDFISPRYTSEVLGDAGNDTDGATEDEERRRRASARHCFYAGHVNGRADETAVVSLCGGLLGAFRSNDAEYLIQPLLEDQDRTRETSTKRHRIFRRSALTRRSATTSSPTPSSSLTSPEPSKCGTRSDSYDSTTANVTLDSNSTSSAALGQQLDGDAASVANATTDSDGGQRRSRRDTITTIVPKFVETLVVCDHHMYRFHRDIENYVLTLMAIVNDIFTHPSIENNIRIVVVKTQYIRSASRGPPLREIAEDQLTEFSNWQYNNHYRSSTGHDVAVFLTRQDICSRTSGQPSCTTLGIARIGGVCNSRQSCGVVEDGGLNSAFTIAHELGHVLGARHDEDTSYCPEETEHRVMSQSLSSNSKPWTWSQCSARLINKFLSKSHITCLNDRDGYEDRYILPPEEPGDVYSLDEQCRLTFGPSYVPCIASSKNYLRRLGKNINDCELLWCKDHSSRTVCRHNHARWADGTPCGGGRKRCQQGKCVDRVRERPPRNGGWGEWGKFTKCTMPCGGGIKSAERKCDSPVPSDGGQYCVGKRKKYKPCNTQACATPFDTLLQQCTWFNNASRHQPFTNKHYDMQWVPDYDVEENDACKLTCRENVTEGEALKVEPARTLADGSPCGRYSDNICVDGICREAGCDHILGSDTRYDACRVCGGDNSTCERHQGAYNERATSVVMLHVVTIPAGATNVYIRQRSTAADDRGNLAADGNYIALFDWKGRAVLNNWEADRKKRITIRENEYTYKSSIYDCDYSGNDDVEEIINCTRKITQDLIVKVMSTGDLTSPMMEWHYWVPKTERFEWISTYQRCSALCHGTQATKAVCKSLSTGKTVRDYFCSDLPRERRRERKCNLHCKFEWTAAQDTECSSRCGPGTRQAHFVCKKWRMRGWDGESAYESKYSPTSVPASYCTERKPSSRQLCTGACPDVLWSYSVWGDCSKTCGTGSVKMRQVRCVDIRGREWPMEECSSLGRPLTQMPCHHQPCHFWRPSEYSPCMCDSKWQTRQVYCAEAGRCPIRLKPVTRQLCDRDTFCWELDWGECSASCDSGRQRQTAVCMRREFGSGGSVVRKSPVSSQYCTPGVKMDERRCNNQPCRRGGYGTGQDGRSNEPIIVNGPRRPEPRLPTTVTSRGAVSRTTEQLETAASWRLGGWTNCSCTIGRKFRLVKCGHPLKPNTTQSSDCRHLPKPHDSELCRPDGCEFFWQAGDFQRCTASCGRGLQQRTVKCISNRRLSQVGDQYCTSLYGQKPPQVKGCELRPCPNRNYPTRRPQVQPRARPTQAPLPTRPSRSIYQWQTASWTTCSESCGKSGLQRREIYCQERSRRRSSAAHLRHCEALPRPQTERECNRRPCPEWRTQPWGECDRECGGGVRRRAITCRDPLSGARRRPEECMELERPNDSRVCNRKPCGKWRKTKWGECSRTCGKGFKTRQVSCHDRRNGTLLPDAACEERFRRPGRPEPRKKPKSVTKCVEQRRCPKWRTEPWLQCACDALQVRNVYCKYKRRVMMEATCDARQRPVSVRRCQLDRCNNYEWSLSEWRNCSETCGNGWKQRTARCMRVATGQRVNDSYCGPQPTLILPCSNGPCSAKWSFGPWTECSRTCGRGGRQTRKIRCTYVNSTTYEEHAVTSCDPATRPYHERDCNLGSCRSDYIWRTGEWEPCSATCGTGISRRRLVCMDRRSRRAINRNLCLDSLYSAILPDTRFECHAAPCKPTSCRELKRMYDVRVDGEYRLLIGNHMANIYCYGMSNETPLEYISLPAGPTENYSEWFIYSYGGGTRCYEEGRRLRSCPGCKKSSEMGLTRFSKIRFIVGQRRVQADDFMFSNTEYGKQIAYGTAGDCLSRAQCPQGRFKINLDGTGFRVSARTQWITSGEYTSSDVVKSNLDQTVDGLCGGYCGRCHPDYRGLILEFDPSNAS